MASWTLPIAGPTGILHESVEADTPNFMTFLPNRYYGVEVVLSSHLINGPTGLSVLTATPKVTINSTGVCYPNSGNVLARHKLALPANLLGALVGSVTRESTRHELLIYSGTLGATLSFLMGGATSATCEVEATCLSP